MRTAMYKTRNKGTWSGMRGTWEMGECYIPGNVAKHSGECPQTFQGMSPNIPRNVAKHSGECSQTFRGMSPNIPGNVVKHFGEYSSNITSEVITIYCSRTTLLPQLTK